MARYSVDGGGQLGAGLLPPSRLGIQGAETQVAVGLERAHAELLGQGEGLPVVGFGLFDFRGIAMCRNVAEEAQGIGLVAAFLVGTGSASARIGESLRLLQATGQQLCLAQGDDAERLESSSPMVIACSIACVSSGMASVTRPARVYAAPRAQPLGGNRTGSPRPDRCPRHVRAGGAPVEVALAEA